METDLRGAATIVDAQPAVSWGAVAAGAVAAAALTLLLVAFGAGMGFSAVSPWSDSGVSGSTFSVATGIYLVLVGIMSSAVGGYIAGRLRSRWTGVHTNEVFPRYRPRIFSLGVRHADQRHRACLDDGLSCERRRRWSSGANGQAARAANPADLYVDKLFRAPPAASAAAAPAPSSDNAANANANSAAMGTENGAIGGARSRSEIVRLWAADFRDGDDLTAADRSYVAQVVAARTGMSQADAEKRVNEVVNRGKDRHRQGPARRGQAFVLADRRAALRCLCGEPHRCRRRRVARRHLE